MSFDRGLGEYLLAHGALHWLVVIELVRMSQTYVAAQGVHMHKTVTAMGTAFGLLVVRFFMPQIPGARGQNFATMANIFLLSDNMFGMTLSVLRQVRVALKMFTLKRNLRHTASKKKEEKIKKKFN